MFRNAALPICFFLFLSFLFHVFPRWGIPLHSDVTWLFRLQTSRDPSLAQVIPNGLSFQGASPQGFFPAFLSWYRLTGRINIADIGALRLIASFAQGDANIWRLVSGFFLGVSLGVFYLVSRKLQVSRLFALVFSLGLLFLPLDVWTDYKTAEPRAVFFLFLACYSALFSRRFAGSVFSIFFFLLSVLTKETFLAFWPFVLAIGVLPLHRSFSPGDISARFVRKRQFLLLHAAGFFLFLLFLFFLLGEGGRGNGGYAFGTYGQEALIRSFLSSYLLWVLPSYVYYNRFLGLILSFFSVVFFLHNRSRIRGALRRVHPLLLSALFLGFFLHGAVYWFSHRTVIGRYVVPANYFFSLLLGLILSRIAPVFHHLETRHTRLIRSTFFLGILFPYAWQGIPDILFFLFLLCSFSLLFFFCHALRFSHRAFFLRHRVFFFLFGLLIVTIVDRGIVPSVVQDRIDQVTWQQFTSSIAADVPDGQHVVLRFDDPDMIETAQSLEATLLLSGKRGLVFHLVVPSEDHAKDSSMPYRDRLITAFNSDRAPIPDSFFLVSANRSGGKDVLRSERRLCFSPVVSCFLRGEFLYTRYISGRRGYLIYTIEHL